MNKIYCLFIFLILVNCTNQDRVYWCGDHPCIDKKEREAYFKKTMTVEIKESKMKDLKNNSEMEKIIQQASVNEKKRIKKEKDLAIQAKLEEKRRIKEEKDLVKQLKQEEKRRVKEEKELAKQLKLEEKRKKREKKALSKQAKLNQKSVNKDKKTILKKVETIDVPKNINNKKAITTESKNFNKLVESIINRNAFKPYPEINDIPE